MNLSGLPSLGLKSRATGKDAWYLAEVHKLPCVICQSFGETQATPTEAHHVICGRLSQRKSPDHMAIPLCVQHHRGELGIHTSRAEWVEKYGADMDYVAVTQDRILGGRNA